MKRVYIQDRLRSVVLLDELDAFLHELAQRDLLVDLERYAEAIQIAYATHSPFMVDPKRMDRVWLTTRSSDAGLEVVRGPIASSNNLADSSNGNVQGPVRGAMEMLLGHQVIRTLPVVLVTSRLEEVILNR